MFHLNRDFFIAIYFWGNLSAESGTGRLSYCSSWIQLSIQSHWISLWTLNSNYKWLYLLLCYLLTWCWLLVRQHYVAAMHNLLLGMINMGFSNSSIKILTQIWHYKLCKVCVAVSRILPLLCPTCHIWQVMVYTNAQCYTLHACPGLLSRTLNGLAAGNVHL